MKNKNVKKRVDNKKKSVPTSVWNASIKYNL